MTKRPKGCARSTAEMDFYISLEPCTSCGKRIDPDGFKFYGGDTAWTMSGPCKHCGEPQGFPFVTFENPLKVEHSFDDLGPGYSEIIAPNAFMKEIMMLSDKLVDDPSKLGLEEWRKNRDISNRLSICVNELSKFFVNHERVISESLLNDEDREYRDEHPEHFTRSWVEFLLDKQKKIDANIIADLKRISKLEIIHKKKRPKGVDWLERDVMQAHEKWVERGRKGKGRLVLVGAEHEAMSVGRGVELSGAHFFDVNLPQVKLADVKFHEAELTNARFEGGGLSGAELQDATIKDSSFRGAVMKNAILRGTKIEATDFSDANLPGSEWLGARVTNGKFQNVTFGDADLTGAQFKDCDFNGADFSVDNSDAPLKTRARFENCDLSNTNWNGRSTEAAEFVNCNLSGSSIEKLN